MTVMFQQALELHRQGRLDEASLVYEAVLAAEPAHVDALVHLGALRHALGQRDEAEALLRRALDLAPHSAEAHANIAAVLQQDDGRYEDAIAHYAQALALKPGMTDARFGLAACLQAAGRHEAAIDCYRQLLATEPSHPEANYGLATVCGALDRIDEAIGYYRAALAADPDFAEASLGLGRALLRRGAAEEAIDCFKRALEVDADYTEARMGLGTALHRLERDGEAIAAFRAVIAREPDNARAHLRLGVVLVRNQREGEAIEHFRRVLAGDPDHIEAMCGLANALRAGGRHEEALALCQTAVSLRPELPLALSALSQTLAELGRLDEARIAARRARDLAPNRVEYAYNLVQLGKVAPDDPVVSALEGMLPHAATMAPRQQCWLHFALAKAYDDTGERDRGFDHLLLGNAVKRQQIAYDESETLGALDRLRRVFTIDLFASRKNVGDPSNVPIFIFGMPRSGTTLVEQILAAHPGVFGAGERRELPELAAALARSMTGTVPFPEAIWLLSGEQIRRVGNDYVAAMRALAPDAMRITDKGLINFRWAGLIRLILPHARMIHVVRDPVDTCLSAFSKLFESQLFYSYELGELGRYYRGYRRLMAHWRAILPAEAMLELRYETLIENFEAEARRTVAFCGLDWDDRCLAFHRAERPVRTASLAQVRQPIYRTSIGRWRPPDAVLRPLIDGLGGLENEP